MHMDRLFGCLLVVASMLSACSTHRITEPGVLDPGKARRTGVLQLHVTNTAAYCGGADPGPEGMPRPMPWRGSFFVRAATPDSTGRMASNDLLRPIIDTISTDGKGRAIMEIPPGHYLLLDQEHVDDRYYEKLLKDHAKPTMYTDPIDTACLRRWLQRPFGVITIDRGDTTAVELPLFERCPWYSTPCMNYFGPLPP